MSKKRKNYNAEEKVTLLKKHLVNKVAVSDICDQYGLHPTVFYRWQKEFFEKGVLFFQQSNDSVAIKLERKIKELEQKVVTKNEVLSELMEEHIALKKSLGEI